MVDIPEGQKYLASYLSENTFKELYYIYKVGDLEGKGEQNYSSGIAESMTSRVSKRKSTLKKYVSRKSSELRDKEVVELTEKDNKVYHELTEKGKKIFRESSGLFRNQEDLEQFAEELRNICRTRDMREDGNYMDVLRGNGSKEQIQNVKQPLADKFRMDPNSEEFRDYWQKALELIRSW